MTAIETPDPNQSPRNLKQKVAAQFGQSSQNYNAQALLQKDCAAELLALLEPWWQKLPTGDVLEIGCGTGFITRGLIQQLQLVQKLQPQAIAIPETQTSAIENASFSFRTKSEPESRPESRPESETRVRSLEVTDLSVDMLHFCQQQLAPNQPDLAIAFRQLDGEDISALTATYALIISGFVIQWFCNPVRSIQVMLEKLQPGGLLCLSFPSCHSFPEWQQQCQELGLPMTANPLPDPHKLIHARFTNSSLVCVQERMIETTYSSSLEFFKLLKLIGAGLSVNGDRLSPQQMKQLIRHWDQKHPQAVPIQHHIVYLLIQRHL